MPLKPKTKKKPNSKATTQKKDRKSNSKRNTQSNRIIKTSSLKESNIDIANSIFTTLTNYKNQIIMNGCKGFAVYFFAEYLKLTNHINPENMVDFINQLSQIEITLAPTLYTTHLLQISDISLKINYLSKMNKMIFKHITSNKILFCSIVKQLQGQIMAIHTFILVNGNTVYNSWTTATGISSQLLSKFNRRLTSQNKNGDCERNSIIMTPKKNVINNDSYNKFKNLIGNNTKFDLLTDLFGLTRDNITGFGRKGLTRESEHKNLIDNDIVKTLDQFKGSEMILIGI